MLVKDLIALLQQQDPEAIAVLSSDGEGNNYSPVSAVSDGFYKGENTWSGSFYDERDQEEEEDEDEEDKCCAGGVAAVGIWPVN